MPIRFALLIRVSTEKQKKKGESLRTQETYLRQYVSVLPDAIVQEDCVYKGQEHATPDYERTLLDRMFEDSAKGRFDAVMIADISRWSRDNLKSKQGLEILRKNGIRFFVGTSEYDLFNPEHCFVLGMSTEVNEMMAQKQNINSLTNRIERAKKGINAAGQLPFGRTYDRKTGQWGIIPEKKRLIEQVAERYLNGENIIDIGREIGMSARGLYRILTKHCGPERTTTFKYKHIKETVTFQIPELLPPETIEAIKNRIYINTSYTRGNRKNYYLLQGFAFCADCGRKLKPRTYHKNRNQYYKHQYIKEPQCKFHKYIHANEFENSVLLLLVKTFSDPDLIEKAIKRSIPNQEKREDLELDKDKLEKQLKKVEEDQRTLLSKVKDKILTDDEIRSEIADIRKTRTVIQTRLNTVINELQHLPDPKKLRKAGNWIGKVLTDLIRHDPTLILDRPYEWKRKLIEKAFTGKDAQGRRLGVYVSSNGDGYNFELRGNLISTIETLPLSDAFITDAFNIDAEYTNLYEEIGKARELLSNVQSICLCHRTKV